MGWNSEVPGHEGWVANVLADGRTTSATDANGPIVLGTDGQREHLPWDQIVAWRVMCECGWIGPSLPATTDPDGLYADWRDCPEHIEDTVMHPPWRQHVAPHGALGQLTEVGAELAQLTKRIENLVDLARSGGISWAAIGAATGLSRQGAQQRWAKG